MDLAVRENTDTILPIGIHDRSLLCFLCFICTHQSITVHCGGLCRPLPISLDRTYFLPYNFRSNIVADVGKPNPFSLAKYEITCPKMYYNYYFDRMNEVD